MGRFDFVSGASGGKQVVKVYTVTPEILLAFNGNVSCCVCGHEFALGQTVVRKNSDFYHGQCFNERRHKK